jgi:hypothetical protein
VSLWLERDLIEGYRLGANLHLDVVNESDRDPLLSAVTTYLPGFTAENS